MRRTAKRAVNIVRVTTLTLLIACALLVTAARLAVNSIDHFQDDITTALSRTLGVPLTVNTIEGDWERLDPTVTVSGLTIGEVGEQPLQVEHVSVHLNSLVSVWEGTAVFSSIDIDGLDMRLTEEAPGVWHVSGLPRGERGFNVDPLLTTANYLKALRLSDVVIHLAGRNATYDIISDARADLVMVRSEKTVSVDLPLQIEKRGQPASAVHLLGQFSGDLTRPDSLELDLFATVPRAELIDFLPAAIAVGEYRVGSADVGANLWLKAKAGQVDAVAELTTNSLQLVGEGLAPISAKASSRLRMKGSHQTGDYSVFMPELKIESQDSVLGLKDVELAITVQGDGLVVAGSIPAIDIGDVSAALISVGRRSGLLPQPVLETMAMASPRGQFRNVNLEYDSSTSLGMHLTAAIHDIGVNAYLGVPGLSSVHGFLSVSGTSGFIDIDNQSFDLHFANLFAQSWPFTSGKGRVTFRFDDGSFYLGSGLIELSDGPMSATGKVQVNIHPDKRLNTWGLVLGIHDADLLKSHRFLPNNLSAELRTWLMDAIVAGTSNESGLLFHGTMIKGVPKVEKVFGLYFDVGDAKLDYQAGWPILEELEALLSIDNRGVFSSNARGTILDAQLSEGNLAIRIDGPAGAEQVELNANISGHLSDGIRILNETPLADITGQMASGWQGEGNLAGNASLNIPVGQAAGQPVQVDLEVELKDNTLKMPQFDITAYDLGGVLRYRTADGLSAALMTATVFDQSVTGSIATRVQDQSGEITVSVNGAVMADRLYEWARQPLLSRVEGLATYQAQIHVPYGGAQDRPSIDVTSDLVGVTLDMPEPMTKSDASEPRQFDYQQEFLADGHRVAFHLDGGATGNLQIAEGLLQGGRISFGEDALGAVTYDKLIVRGRVPQADYVVWNRFFQEIQSVSDVSLESEAAASLDDIRLNVDELLVYDLVFTGVDLQIRRSGPGWLITLVDENIAGDITLFDDDESPLVVNLDFLAVPTGDGDDTDPLLDMDPGDLFAIDFSTEKLMVGDEDFGRWQFDVRPDVQGAQLTNLSASVLGLELLTPGNLKWWRTDGQHYSEFTGDVAIPELGPALQAWGYASSIEGQEFLFQPVISWQGSPAMIELERLSGDISIKQGKGRFVQADSGTGALKLLGIFDFAQLARRFRFDFSDVVDKGYSFNGIQGRVSLDRGLIAVSEPIEIDGTGSKFTVAGTVNLLTRELDNDMIVTLPVGDNLPWYAAYSAIVTGPLVGAGVLLAQKIFESQINTMSSAKYQISGTIESPNIEFISIFNDQIRENKPATEAAPSE